MMRLSAILISMVLSLNLLQLNTATDEVIPIDYLEDAEMCYELGLIVGSGDGVTADYLESDAKRIHATVILLRMLGLESDMLEFDYIGMPNFKDVSSNGYEQRLLAYLYEHDELGWIGNDAGEFNASQDLTAKMLTKVLLEILGFEQGYDFSWSTVFDKANQLGMNKYSEYDNPTLNIAEVCDLIVEALTKLKRDQTLLISDLIDSGIINESIAVDLGLIRAGLNIEYVDVESFNQLKVYLNVPIDQITVDDITVSGAFIESVKLEESGQIMYVRLVGIEAGKYYTIKISGSKYGNIVQKNTHYTFKVH